MAFWGWVVAQSTLVQFYNPEFLRTFGVGVVNGSLWTIPVELQFYLLLPILVAIGSRSWFGLTVQLLTSAVLLLLMRPYMGDDIGIGGKLLSVSIVPYLFYFLLGVALRRVMDRRPGMFAGKALVWTVAYLLWIAVEVAVDLDRTSANPLNVASIALLGTLTISLAYSNVSWSSRVLNGNDISYGVYIYHMPLLNGLLSIQVAGLTGLAVLFASTFLCALVSWRLIEAPALRLKTHSVIARAAKA